MSLNTTQEIGLAGHSQTFSDSTGGSSALALCWNVTESPWCSADESMLSVPMKAPQGSCVSGLHQANGSFRKKSRAKFSMNGDGLVAKLCLTLATL